MSAISLDALTRRFDKVEKAAEELDARGWPAPLDLRELAQREPEAPRWVVPQWLPEGYATLVAGHGGVGKSQVALTLAACIASGRPWCGLPVTRKRVLYLSCEDRQEILHWRLVRIARHLEVELGTLAGWLDVLDLVGTDTLLWTPELRHATPAASAFRQALAEGEHGVVVLDGLTDTFAGNENDKAHAKAYINSLLGAMPRDGAVVVVAHVNKATASGAAVGREDYSGSVAWHNACRARWVLAPEKLPGPDGTDEPSGDLLLTNRKANHGESGAELRFSWDAGAGLYLGRQVVPEGALDVKARERRERDGIVACIQAVEARGGWVPAATTGQRTAYHVLLAEPDFPASLADGSRPTKRRFWRHLEDLRRMCVVGECSIRRTDGRYRTGLTAETRTT